MHTRNETICAMTVASAAPSIPQPNPSMKRASSKMFRTAPLTIHRIA